MKTRRMWMILILGVLLAGLPASYHPVQAADTKNKTISITASPAEQQRTAAFWTSERMRQAVPLVWREEASAPYDEATDQARGPQPVRSVVTIPQAAPNPEALALAKQLYPEAWQAPAAPEALPTRSVLPNYIGFSRYIMNEYGPRNEYPFAAIGKLFFTLPNGTPSSCSASVIARRGLVTAAHCVYTVGAGWHGNLMFSPAHRGDNSYYGPYGRFYYSSATILTERMSNPTRYNDVAVVAVWDQYGYPIQSWVGNLGLLWNASPNQGIWAFGYPGNIGGSQLLVACASNSQEWETSGAMWWKRTRSIKMGCDMTYGSSGGPWIVNYAPYFVSTGNYVNSVVSGPAYDPSIPEFQGPYFDNDNMGVLWNVIANR